MTYKTDLANARSVFYTQVIYMISISAVMLYNGDAVYPGIGKN